MQAAVQIERADRTGSRRTSTRTAGFASRTSRRAGTTCGSPSTASTRGPRCRADRGRTGREDRHVPEIPGGRSNEPLDLGTITARLHETLKAGDLAPDFTVRRIGGPGDGGSAQAERPPGQAGPASTSGRPGTTARAAPSSPRSARHPARSSAATRDSGSSPSGATGPPRRPSGSIKEKKLTWTQGFAGNLSSRRDELQAPRQPRRRSWSARTAASWRRTSAGSALKEAIAGALKDEALFKARAWAPRPARFPVTRFEAAASAAGREPTDEADGRRARRLGPGLPRGPSPSRHPADPPRRPGGRGRSRPRASPNTTPARRSAGSTASRSTASGGGSISASWSPIA